MSRVLIRWEEAPRAREGRLKPYLLLALTLAVLAVYGPAIIR